VRFHEAALERPHPPGADRPRLQPRSAGGGTAAAPAWLSPSGRVRATGARARAGTSSVVVPDRANRPTRRPDGGGWRPAPAHAGRPLRAAAQLVDQTRARARRRDGTIRRWGGARPRRSGQVIPRGPLIIRAAMAGATEGDARRGFNLRGKDSAPRPPAARSSDIRLHGGAHGLGFRPRFVLAESLVAAGLRRPGASRWSRSDLVARMQQIGIGDKYIQQDDPRPARRVPARLLDGPAALGARRSAAKFVVPPDLWPRLRRVRRSWRRACCWALNFLGGPFRCRLVSTTDGCTSCASGCSGAIEPVVDIGSMIRPGGRRSGYWSMFIGGSSGPGGCRLRHHPVAVRPALGATTSRRCALLVLLRSVLVANFGGPRESRQSSMIAPTPPRHPRAGR